MPDWVSLAAIASAAVVLAQVAVYVIALGVIPGGRKPSTGMAWLILILAVPLLGIVMFLLLGSTHVGRKRNRAQISVNERIQERTAEIVRVIRKLEQANAVRNGRLRSAHALRDIAEGK